MVKYKVWFLPTVKTPLKDRGLADIKHRAAMIRMIIKPYRNFKLSMIEEKNTVPSYSINTARLLHRMYPDDKFYWLIGSDVLDQLDHWKDIDELKKLGNGKIHVTIGSALDIFGGKLDFDKVVDRIRIS